MPKRGYSDVSKGKKRARGGGYKSNMSRAPQRTFPSASLAGKVVKYKDWGISDHDYWSDLTSTSQYIPVKLDGGTANAEQTSIVNIGRANGASSRENRYIQLRSMHLGGNIHLNLQRTTSLTTQLPTNLIFDFFLVYDKRPPVDIPGGAAAAPVEPEEIWSNAGHFGNPVRRNLNNTDRFIVWHKVIRARSEITSPYAANNTIVTARQDFEFQFDLRKYHTKYTASSTTGGLGTITEGNLMIYLYLRGGSHGIATAGNNVQQMYANISGRLRYVDV